MTALPPTTFLPAIKSLSSLTSTDRLRECIIYLRQMYIPQVRGSRRRKRKVGSGSSVQKDHFERDYTLRWLSALIRLELDDLPELCQVQNDAAALLAICAGSAAAGTVQRQLEFDEGRIKVVLNDIPLSTSATNGDYFGSVGSQTWGGACVLADEIADNAERFFLPDRRMRVLELGAGTGLVSLVASKVAMLHGRRVDIVATDYYPSVLDNLKANIETNFAPGSVPAASLTLSCQFLDWSMFSGDDVPLGGNTFDMILGADIVYEPLHASWIRSVVWNTLRRPGEGGGGGLFHLVIPLRPSFATESSTVEKEFQPGSGNSLCLVILYSEIILCDAEEHDNRVEETEDGDGDAVRYAYYIIGWGEGKAI